MRKLALLPLLVLSSACVSTANIQPEAVQMESDSGQFVPVMAFYNRNVPVTRFYVSRLEAVEAALKKSGAFFDVGPHVNSPIILDMELTRGTSDTAVNSAAQILSAATLFLVPTKANNFNVLKVDVYAYGNLIKSYEYKQEYEQVIGMHNYNEMATNSGNEFLSIENLVNQFINDLNKDQLLPRVILNKGRSTGDEKVIRPEQET